MIGKLSTDVLALFTTFDDLSVLRNLFSKTEKRRFGAAGTEMLRIKLKLPEFRGRTPTWPTWP